MQHQTKQAPLSAKEIAPRIDAHLRRFERDKTGVNAPHDGKPGGLSDYYWAGAHATKNGRVLVTYITYQSHSRLTLKEARHYLALLDAGFVGRHYEAFRAHPVPQ